MYVSFRQGIIDYQPNFLNWVNPTSISITTTNKPVYVTFAHWSADYLHVEPVRQSPFTAWTGLPISTHPNFWIYWDIDIVTAQISYGWTVHEPVVANTNPFTTTPQENQHWFDTSINVMKVWNGTRWLHKIRVFAARIENSSIIFPYSVGTQIGNNNSCNAGRIIRNAFGKPIRKDGKVFLTTEDSFFVDGFNYPVRRFETDILYGKSAGSIPKFSVVKLQGFDQFAIANYEDTDDYILGMALSDAPLYSLCTITLQGVIENPDWNWSVPNAKLWVDRNGELTTTDPGILDVDRGSHQPVARVLSKTSILFGQGYFNNGGIYTGPTFVNASTVQKGVVKLSFPPANPTNPIAVGEGDPRLTNPRPPTQHSHTTTEIFHNNTQLNNIVDVHALQISQKLNLSGGVLTGPLTLNADPIIPLHAATKQYVDNSIINRTYSLNDLSNVQISSVSDGQILTWDNNIQKWSPKTLDQVSTMSPFLELTTIQNTIQQLQNTISNMQVTYAPINHTHPYLSLQGGTLTGALELTVSPSQPTHAVTKAYVDTKDAMTRQYIDNIISSKSFVHQQTVSSNIWTIVHNLNTQNIIFFVYINVGSQLKLVFPQDMEFQSNNAIKIFFNSFYTGRVIIIAV